VGCISYSVIQKDFDSLETNYDSGCEGESVVQAEKCVREKQGERKKSTEKTRTRERSALKAQATVQRRMLGTTDHVLWSRIELRRLEINWSRHKMARDDREDVV
jgi:hypothetical protein